MKNQKQPTKRNTRKVQPVKQTKETAKTTRVKADRSYKGAPIPASRLFMRKLDAFKTCEAVCFLALNEKTGTATYCNSYNGSPRDSYRAEDYTYPIVEKKIAKKTAEMIEVEPDEFPPFFTTVTTKITTRKTTKTSK